MEKTRIYSFSKFYAAARHLIITFLFIFGLYLTFECKVDEISSPIDGQPFLIDHIHINISTQLISKFSGVVTIDLNLLKERKNIFFHASEKLDIYMVTLNNSHTSWNSLQDDVLEIGNMQRRPPGAYQLQIWYHSTFNEGAFHLLGNYHSVAFTNFEPISARTVFPCLDIPSVKTTYSATFSVNASFQVRFNTDFDFEEVSNSSNGDIRRISFPKTIPLPSYLVRRGKKIPINIDI